MFAIALDKVWDDLSGSLGRTKDLKECKAPPKAPRAMTRVGGA